MKKLLILIIGALCACEGDVDTVEHATIAKKEKTDKYVYLDKTECLHVNRACLRINHTGGISISLVEEDGDLNSYNGSGIMRIPVESVTYDNITWCCGRCVTDEEYERLEAIARKNLRPN